MTGTPRLFRRRERASVEKRGDKRRDEKARGWPPFACLGRLLGEDGHPLRLYKKIEEIIEGKRKREDGQPVPL